MSFTVIVPARMGSTRLPGKPLAQLAGEPMIIHVLKRATQSGARKVIVATDSSEIAKTVEVFGYGFHLTGECDSGSERAAMAAREMDIDGVIVNLQCDEPEIDPALITEVAKRAEIGYCDCATAAAEINEEDANNPDVVKVVTGHDGFALYFSRAAIPARRGSNSGEVPYLGHLGIYAFAPSKILELLEMQTPPIAAVEGLEQLTWLWNNWRIAIVDAESFTHGIDTKKDLELANERLSG